MHLSPAVCVYCDSKNLLISRQIPLSMYAEYNKNRRWKWDCQTLLLSMGCFGFGLAFSKPIPKPRCTEQQNKTVNEPERKHPTTQPSNFVVDVTHNNRLRLRLGPLWTTLHGFGPPSTTANHSENPSENHPSQLHDVCGSWRIILAARSKPISGLCKQRICLLRFRSRCSSRMRVYLLCTYRKKE